MAHKPIKLGNATINAHLAWCNDELTPPVVMSRETAYVVTCFREALILLRYHEDHCGH